MEQPSKPPPDDFPLLRGVEDKCEKITAQEIFGSHDREGYSRVLAPLTYPQERSTHNGSRFQTISSRRDILRKLKSCLWL